MRCGQESQALPADSKKVVWKVMNSGYCGMPLRSIFGLIQSSEHAYLIIGEGALGNRIDVVFICIR